MGQFDWFKSLGASDRAVAVLNDQPQLFTTLILVIVGLLLECLFIWFIHFSTMKPEQKNKKKKKTPPAKPDGAKGKPAGAGPAPARGGEVRRKWGMRVRG
ncbi:hypothetical protein ACRE_024000 [Hapsidospora chrysogenum ATCC 11550]|uniref:Uncharacterized protein n=1 Tax=Hapsidospora chrysogenum (strain ATCC 11550 / CBS 779.69 / DSM 880 / IAM 14645 / JCM 23072 / IMI 49137) TaxID=857340 RepID=A0A086TBM8_HAPC1|nr:hypothetical protein ACRE_024000 [Hapsidospora chrysogenum ATCC 11550]